MLATFFVILVIFPMYLIGHKHPESVTNISKLSPTHLVSNIRHQHRCNLKLISPILKVNRLPASTMWSTGGHSETGFWTSNTRHTICYRFENIFNCFAFSLLCIHQRLKKENKGQPQSHLSFTS